MNAVEAKVLVDKLCSSAESERLLGNTEAASTFEAKAEKLRRRYNLTAAAPAPEVKEQVAAQPKAQHDYWGNFPGVSPREEPLTADQLAALRKAAADVGGRMLTDAEAARALGREHKAQQSESGAVSDIWI
jgi:hypothetical protein